MSWIKFDTTPTSWVTKPQAVVRLTGTRGHSRLSPHVYRLPLESCVWGLLFPSLCGGPGSPYYLNPGVFDHNSSSPRHHINTNPPLGPNGRCKSSGSSRILCALPHSEWVLPEGLGHDPNCGTASIEYLNFSEFNRCFGTLGQLLLGSLEC